jgi:dihydroorotate dehydrogenase
VFGLTFLNPVGLAAGFDKDASFYKEFRNLGFGFIEIGTVTPKAQPGNPKPRSFRLPEDRALINRMGFNNLGVDAAVEKLLNRDPGFIIGGNIGKNTLTPNSEAVNDYEYCFTRLYDYVDYFVVNVSCPNISDLSELQDQALLMGILNRLIEIRSTKTLKKPVLLKISPDLNWKQIDETINIVKNSGIDGLVATNTTIRRDMLTTDKNIVNSIGKGGLSGAPITDRSNEIIKYIRQKSGNAFPIIGVGGIMSVEDAKAKLAAGADLIQVYTGFIYEGPGFVKQILKSIT